MREIRFRAWDGKKMWYEADIVSDPVNFYFMTLNGLLIIKTPNEEAHDSKWELMQYTGLKDKKGKVIYEGDIVKCGCDFTDEYEWTGIVKFDLGAFYVADRKGKGRAIYYWSTETFGDIHVREVIGNIYENPELVKI
jgi:uncharacterized phage protein (TIGR01671 family)